jgi:hypothetical protein
MEWRLPAARCVKGCLDLSRGPPQKGEGHSQGDASGLEGIQQGGSEASARITADRVRNGCGLAVASTATIPDPNADGGTRGEPWGTARNRRDLLAFASA